MRAIKQTRVTEEITKMTSVKYERLSLCQRVNGYASLEAVTDMKVDASHIDLFELYKDRIIEWHNIVITLASLTLSLP